MPTANPSAWNEDHNGRAALDPHTWSIGGIMVSVGRGIASAHHGELFQGQFRDGAGTVRRCLLSLPCTQLFSRAVFHPRDTDRIAVEPSHKYKARTTIELTLDYLNARDIGGTVAIESNIPEGKGYGSSTADCVAAVRAVADAFGQRLADAEIARIAVRAESASDNTMFDHAVLFAQREAVVVEDYALPVPRMEVLGFDTDVAGIVDTLVNPPAVYSSHEIELFHTLIPALRRAIRTQDVWLLGRIATTSAIINQRFLPKAHFDDVHQLAQEVGALGLAAAHSGTVLGILLDPGDPWLANKVRDLRSGLATLGLTNVFHFGTWASCVGRPMALPRREPA